LLEFIFCLELFLKAKTKAKDSRPRTLLTRPRPRTLLSRPRPQLFVLEEPRGRGQVLEDTSLQKGKTGKVNQSGFTGARDSEWQWHFHYESKSEFS